MPPKETSRNEANDEYLCVARGLHDNYTLPRACRVSLSSDGFDIQREKHPLFLVTSQKGSQFIVFSRSTWRRAPLAAHHRTKHTHMYAFSIVGFLLVTS